MQKTIEKLEGKRILIWGYGREGKSTEKFIKEYCRPALVDILEGTREEVRDEAYDYIIVSPGICFEEDAPAFDNRKFTSQTELFLEEYGAKTVGITGTKGKSTTSSMLYQVLDACSGHKTFLMGNIGKPCWDYLPEMTEDSIAVFELSCHQCQRLQAAPHTAVFLDLYEDHLDRYHEMQHYFEAKCGITRCQTEGDFLFVGENVPDIATKAVKRAITLLPEDHFDLRVPGMHNQLNARFVLEIASCVFGCSKEAIREALKEFRGLPHRLENCGCIDGIDYYDDSISTIPEAAIRAATSVANAKTLLIGGMDRGIEYDILIDFIGQHPEYQFILAYASGKRILESVKDCPNVHYVEDLAAQVRLAQEITPKGGAVIMSNAAASYGYFKNFEERGDVFQRLIHAADGR